MRIKDAIADPESDPRVFFRTDNHKLKLVVKKSNFKLYASRSKLMEAVKAGSRITPSSVPRNLNGVTREPKL